MIGNRGAVCLLAGLAAAVAAAAVGSWAVLGDRRHQVEATAALIHSQLDARRSQILRYLHEVDVDLSIVSDTRLAQDAVAEMVAALADLPPPPLETLRRLYVDGNPDPAGRRHMLVAASDGSTYSALHRRYHGWFSNIAAVHDFHDLFLVSPRGDVVYSVAKSPEFGTNLRDGPFADSGLGAVFRDLAEAPRHGRVVARDFDAHAADGAPSAFAGTSITVPGAFAGTLVAQIKTEPFDEAIQSVAGLDRATGIYVVTARHMALGDLLPERDIAPFEAVTPTAPIAAALRGETGFDRAVDPWGTPVFAAWAPVDWHGLRWAVVAERPVATVVAPTRRLAIEVGAIGLALALLAALAGYLLAAPDPPRAGH